MIRYRYNQQVSPPAPFIQVQVGRPVGGTPGVVCPAQLDSGADMSVVPQRLVAESGLLPMGEVPTLGFGGVLATMTTYLVRLQVHDLPPREIEALAGPDEPHVLLGRDMLNGYRVTLDGPNLILEIG